MTHPYYATYFFLTHPFYQAQKSSPIPLFFRLIPFCTLRPVPNNDSDKDVQRFLFFDVETNQETGTHLPNLIVVHDQDGVENVFRGPNTRYEFCSWLLTEENEDRT